MDKDELKQQLEACKTPEEFEALVKENGFELSDEAMGAIAGGSGETYNVYVVQGWEEGFGGRQYERETIWYSEEEAKRYAASIFKGEIVRVYTRHR